ncbi:MAG TPA: hypothetical protein VFM75_07280, partial [Modicisalibacter sp.]|nr:hypothetical protein [Modicisalibacter sp.]
NVQNPNLDKYFTVENSIEGMSIPLHAGAVKFFEEQGIEVPSDLMPPESGGETKTETESASE